MSKGNTTENLEAERLERQLTECQWTIGRLLAALESLNSTGRWSFGAFEEMQRARELLARMQRDEQNV